MKNLAMVSLSLLLFFALVSSAWAPTPKALVEEPAFFKETIMKVANDVVVRPSLRDRVMSHPDAIKLGDGWYRIVVKENLSNTNYDWRFDQRMIDTRDGITIGHREEQNSGNVPDSNWVIEYTLMDKFADGTLDYFDKERFLSVKFNESWSKITIRWADEFLYPYPSDEEFYELYKKELEYWNNKL